MKPSNALKRHKSPVSFKEEVVKGEPEDSDGDPFRLDILEELGIKLRQDVDNNPTDSTEEIIAENASALTITAKRGRKGKGKARKLE